MRENKQLTKEVTSATIGGNYETHEYDSIGNSIIASFNGTTNAYSANNLNQYTMVGRVVPNARHGTNSKLIITTIGDSK